MSPRSPPELEDLSHVHHSFCNCRGGELTAGATVEGTHSLVVTEFVLSRCRTYEFVAGGEQYDGDQRHDQTERRCDAPLSEHNTQVLRRPGEDHLDDCVS